MKKIDVTKSVMEDIVLFETQRTRKWLVIFIGSIALITCLIVMVAIQTYGTLLERHTLDVLEILSQDREIISEFWQDTLLVFWEEFPQQSIFLGIGLVSMLISIFVLTKRRRKIVAKRFEELAKRHKRRNNT